MSTTLESHLHCRTQRQRQTSGSRPTRTRDSSGRCTSQEWRLRSLGASHRQLPTLQLPSSDSSPLRPPLALPHLRVEPDSYAGAAVAAQQPLLMLPRQRQQRRLPPLLLQLQQLRRTLVAEVLRSVPALRVKLGGLCWVRGWVWGSCCPWIAAALREARNKSWVSEEKATRGRRG